MGNPLTRWMREALAPGPVEAAWDYDGLVIEFVGDGVADRAEACVRCGRPIAPGEEVTVVNVDEDDGAILLGWPLCAACREQIEQRGTPLGHYAARSGY
ncbi:hypothetical protein [Thermalbibacter longus]|nr:hypothetical protein [Thermalbibacter longus]